MATGPFQVFSNGSGANFGINKVWYRSNRLPDGTLVLENNPFVYSRCTVKNGRDYLGAPLGNYGLSWHHAQPSGAMGVANPAAYASAYDRFADKAWGSAQATLAVDFAERNETLRMLGDSINRLYRAAVLTRKRRFREAMRALSAQPPGRKFKPSDEFFANWMALRYGWIPTLGSVHSLCEVLANPITSKSGLCRGSVNGSYEYQTINHGYLDYSGKWEYHVHVQGRVAISDPRLAGLNQYGLLNPLAVAWELVSKSFVVGWFLPIGDILADQTRFVGLSITEGCVVHRLRGEDFVYWTGFPYPTYTSHLKERQPFSGDPPTPSRLLAGKGLNAIRVMDSLALLTGALRQGFLRRA